MDKAGIIEVFKQELGLIHDTEIRDFVVDVIDTMAPGYFWTSPASTTGKYHPQLSLGEGGIIRHTKLAVWWGVEFMRTEEVTGLEHDVVIAALILHDLKKNGDTLAGGKPIIGGIVHSHGTRLADDIWSKKFKNLSGPAPIYAVLILEGIAHHMGRWTCPNWTQNPPRSQDWQRTIIRRIVHLADYCASRRVDAKIAELLG